MHKHVELLIGRLATDSELLRRFTAQPLETVRGQALELTEVEIAAIAATDPDALRDFAEALDARLRKAALASETRNASHPTPASSEAALEKEIPS